MSNLVLVGLAAVPSSAARNTMPKRRVSLGQTTPRDYDLRSCGAMSTSALNPRQTHTSREL